MFRLTSHVQDYDWGSTTDIPAALGIAAGGEPQAEMWFGAHPSAPSVAAPVVARLDAAGTPAAVAPLPLDEAIAADPALLGSRVAARFGARLPYLVKLLAAARPLSLQAHPDAVQAKERHEREIADDVPPALRNYPDAFHKPEMLVALVPTLALAGFREPDAVAADLAELGVDGLAEVVDVLRGPEPSADRVRRAFELVLALPAETVAAVLRAVRTGPGGPAGVAGPTSGGPTGVAGPTSAGIAAVLAEHYTDQGVVASFLLNPVALRPGQGLYVGAGVVHCYVNGFGLEVMAGSDNVLRAGLTTKRVDVAELLSVVDFAPSPADTVVPDAVWTGPDAVEQRYPTPAEDFELTIVDVHGEGGAVLGAETGPRVLVCLEGVVRVAGAYARCGLAGGESVFASHDDGPLTLAGHGRIAVVSVPAASRP